MEVHSVLITGANRGIGLELVKQFVSLPKPPRYIFATYRDRDSVGDLEKLRDASQTSKVILIQMDITRDEDIEKAQNSVEETVKENGLNLLINNAGAYVKQQFPHISDDNLMFHFQNNAIGPIKVFQGFLPQLQKAAALNENAGMSVSRALVLNVSSVGGSIKEIMDKSTPIEFISPLIGYRMSKCALNMAMRVISLQVKDQGILVVNMCPGWVRTRMGTERALITVEESVSAILHTLLELNISHHGTFMDRNGCAIPY